MKEYHIECQNARAGSRNRQSLATALSSRHREVFWHFSHKCSCAIK